MDTHKSIIDVTAAIDRFEGDRSFYLNLAGAFLANFPGRLSALQGAIDQSIASVICEISHQLKGALLNLSADCAAEVALNIERRARNNELSEMKILIKNLETEVIAFKQFLEVIEKSNVWNDMAEKVREE